MVEKKLSHLPHADHRQLIRKQAAKLAELLCQSPEYSQFIAARTALESDYESASILAELRQQQMMVRMAAMIGEGDSEDEAEFDNMFVQLTQEQNISDYLFAEGRFLRLMADIEDVFTHKLDLWRYVDDEEAPVDYDINLN